MKAGRKNKNKNKKIINADNTENREERRGTEPGDHRNCKEIIPNSSQKLEKDHYGRSAGQHLIISPLRKLI